MEWIPTSPTIQDETEKAGKGTQMGYTYVAILHASFI
jgi:hypothetical protein